MGMQVLTASKRSKEALDKMTGTVVGHYKKSIKVRLEEGPRKGAATGFAPDMLTILPGKDDKRDTDSAVTGVEGEGGAVGSAAAPAAESQPEVEPQGDEAALAVALDLFGADALNAEL